MCAPYDLWLHGEHFQHSCDHCGCRSPFLQLQLSSAGNSAHLFAFQLGGGLFIVVWSFVLCTIVFTALWFFPVKFALTCLPWWVWLSGAAAIMMGGSPYTRGKQQLGERGIDTIFFFIPPPLSLFTLSGYFASTLRRGGRSTFRGTSCSPTSMRLVLPQYLDFDQRLGVSVRQPPQHTSHPTRHTPSTLQPEILVTLALECDGQ